MVDLGTALGDEEAAKEILEGDSEEDGESDSSEQDDELTRFRTYEEPEDVDDDFDVDRNAVKQFVDEFASVSSDDGSDLKAHKKTIFNAFSAWAEINNVSLDELSEDVWINHRKGNLNGILESEYNLNEGKYTVRGERTDGFRGISLSDEIYKLID